jgi:predicted RNA-binding Zn-ribbon protein involved in translation (DUF1610 family)
MTKGKLSTPDWIREGFDSKADWEKSHGTAKKKKTDDEKTFKVKKCPKCGSYNVNVVLSEQEGSDDDEDMESSKKVVGEWECKKCGWSGKDVEEDELTENEFMKYLDEKGEEVA